MTTTDHRPTTLDGIVGQQDIVKFLKAVVARPAAEAPHLLFHGPAGTGKTTASLAFASEFLGDSVSSNLLMLNASEVRGIDAVREQILPFLGRLPEGEAKRKIVFLDEADKLTPEAQSALRQPIEEYEEYNLFLFACNEPHRLIPPLRESRLLNLAFRPIRDEDVRELLMRIAGEQVASAQAVANIDNVVRFAHGDARRAIGMFLNEFGEGDKYQRLDAEIRAAFDAKAGTKDERLLRFLKFLREEGFTNWEEVLVIIAHMGRDGQLPIPADRRTQLVANAVNYAFRCGQVQLPMFQVEGFLVGEVP